MTNKTYKWYGIKEKNRWFAYNVAPSSMKHLKRGVQYCGPFNSLSETLIKVNDAKTGIKTA